MVEQNRWNERIANLMSDLSVIMTKRGDMIRARTYKRAEETILSIPTDIHSLEDLKGKPGIGPTILEKVDEYMKTGTLQLIEREKARPENILTDVYGIGPKKAEELVKIGITSIDELRKRPDVLNQVQRTGLKYYEDILERIPRSEIDKYNQIFENAFQPFLHSCLSNASKSNSYHDALEKCKDVKIASKYEIVGSYRRGALNSGDIDVIITSREPSVFSRFIDSLRVSGIILEVLSQGKSKSLFICKIPGAKYARRVDFLYSTPEEYPFSILYFTGSKGFNTVMRGHALKMGYSLNEHGFTRLHTKEKIEQIFENEKSIFDFLGLEFKEPAERVDGRAVVPISKGINISEIPKIPKEPTRKIKEPKIPKIPKEPKTRKVKKPEIPKIIPKDSLETKRMKTFKRLESPKKNELSKKDKRKTRKIRMVETLPPITTSTRQMILEFKEKGITVLSGLSEKTLSDMIRMTNEQYYNTQNPLLTDNEYDILKEYIERTYPKNAAIQEIGAPVGKNKVSLPYEMPSMDKIKPDTGALDAWARKYSGPYLLSCKLDGVSGLYIMDEKTPKLYTRGNGTIGQDITHFLSSISLPRGQPGSQIAVRGEFILPKKTFSEKYKDTFSNARNLVSGIINSKTADEKTRDLHFVAYEVVSPPMRPSEQMAFLLNNGFEVVQYQAAETLSNEFLSGILLEWRHDYEYVMDGVIVTDDKIYPRKSGNPEHAFAFKMVISDQQAEAKVVDVLWTPSKNGYLKPRIRIEPVHLGGVTIEYATGFNGKFIEDNKIGIGAVVQLVRSGDVIPYITGVTSPAEHPKMPDVPYIWTDTKVDILLENKDVDNTVQLKNVAGFFTHLEVEGLSTGNVKRFFAAGYTTVPVILKMTKKDFEKVEGFKEKMIEKIYNSMHEKVGKATLLDIMVASNKMGRGLGERKIKPILEEYPDILTLPIDSSKKEEMLKMVKGIGKENAHEFVSNIGDFLAFLEECALSYKLREKAASLPLENRVISIEHPLYQKKIVMTKVRDKTILDAMAKYGANLEDSVKKDTFALIVKSKEDNSNKMEAAKKYGISIFTPDEFIRTYL
jgi:NAD-dependent DNA ligase/DNA polymerase/3'-5' exonuclease PolX